VSFTDVVVVKLHRGGAAQPEAEAIDLLCIARGDTVISAENDSNDR
jgi:hypothetical protein